MKRRRDHVAGDFLVSASDLMASLVFIFVIVAVLFAFRARSAEQNFKEAETKSKAAKVRADVQEEQLKAANDAVAGAASARQELLLKLKDALKDKLKVEVTDDGLRFQADVLFDSGAASLKPGGKDALRLLSGELAQLLPCFVPRATNASTSCVTTLKYPRGVDALLVEGHTDRVPLGIQKGTERVDGNWDLSAQRAIAAFRELEPGLGGFVNLKSQRILGVAGYGSSRSTEAENPDAGVANSNPRDRRIEIRILMAAPEIAGGENGTARQPH